MFNATPTGMIMAWYVLGAAGTGAFMVFGAAQSEAVRRASNPAIAFAFCVAWPMFWIMLLAELGRQR